MKNKKKKTIKALKLFNAKQAKLAKHFDQTFPKSLFDKTFSKSFNGKTAFFWALIAVFAVVIIAIIFAFNQTGFATLNKTVKGAPKLVDISFTVSQSSATSKSGARVLLVNLDIGEQFLGASDVTITEIADLAALKSCTTNSSGICSMKKVPNGNYVLIAVKQNCSSNAQSITISGTRAISKRISLNCASTVKTTTGIKAKKIASGAIAGRFAVACNSSVIGKCRQNSDSLCSELKPESVVAQFKIIADDAFVFYLNKEPVLMSNEKTSKQVNLLIKPNDVLLFLVLDRAVENGSDLKKTGFALESFVESQPFILSNANTNWKVNTAKLDAKKTIPNDTGQGVFIGENSYYIEKIRLGDTRRLFSVFGSQINDYSNPSIVFSGNAFRNRAKESNDALSRHGFSSNANWLWANSAGFGLVWFRYIATENDLAQFKRIDFVSDCSKCGCANSTQQECVQFENGSKCLARLSVEQKDYFERCVNELDEQVCYLLAGDYRDLGFDAIASRLGKIELCENISNSDLKNSCKNRVPLFAAGKIIPETITEATRAASNTYCFENTIGAARQNAINFFASRDISSADRLNFLIILNSDNTIDSVSRCENSCNTATNSC